MTSRSSSGTQALELSASVLSIAARQSPGASNTRALTPGGDNEANPLVLQIGLDWLKLAYRVALNDFELPLLVAALGDTAERASSYEVAGEVFELRALNDDATRFRLTNATKTVIVGEDFTGFPVQVELRGLYLRTESLERVEEEAEQLARHFAAGDIAEVRVWRCDLCVDVGGISFCRDDEDNCVTRARTHVRFQSPESVFSKKRGDRSRVTGFSIGKRGAISVRIYDKTEELLAVHGAESEKTRTELGTYRSAGWDGRSPVWRVEAELHGDFLRQYEAGTPRELLKRLDSLWHYVVGREDGAGKTWLRFVLPGAATRIERRKTDPRWVLFQRASFSGLQAAEKVEGDRGGVSAAQLLGDALSFLGSRSNLPELSERPTRELIREDFARAADQVTLVPHLVDTYLRRRAAARARRWARPKAGEDP